MKNRRIRYAVVGQGYFAQAAVLPAFRHARNCELTALVSGDPLKLRKLSRDYGVGIAVGYEGYDELLKSGKIDAVYIALPNDLHKDFAIRAARAGIHVLCEKPMAVTSRDCEAMIRAARDARVKLMIAYRLHFEEANLRAVELVQSGKLGEPRFFSSVFSIQVRPDNIRARPVERGGGPLHDIGIYCVNAARYLFREEPIEVTAVSSLGGRTRARQHEELVSCTLRFPGGKLASFTCGFGNAPTDYFHVVGTKGELCLDHCYEYAEEMEWWLTVDGRTTSRKFAKRDQIAPELTYFSECILKNRQPEPSGMEGLADLRIIEALVRSARTGRPVTLEPARLRQRPGLLQQRRAKAVREPRLVRAQSPGG
jgi:predicted dehydrogenase